MVGWVWSQLRNNHLATTESMRLILGRRICEQTPNDLFKVYSCNNLTSFPASFTWKGDSEFFRNIYFNSGGAGVEASLP